ncbi:MAG: hypothetical protein ACJZ37_02810 [Candidatus Poseidoniales archaeon]
MAESGSAAVFAWEGENLEEYWGLYLQCIDMARWRGSGHYC